MKTKISLIVISSVAIILNIILIATGNKSMSATIQSVMGNYPIIGVAIGIFVGHWAWPVGGLKNE